MPDFRVVAPFEPTGDQPEAIEALANGIENGLSEQVLLGVTGSGKTYTMAKLIERIQRPTLVLAHNKTLAAQLCAEFKEFFPDNAVEYFVSYYDYYQPEAYIPHTDTFIEKDASTNQEIDRLRHSATSALFERRDVIVVASVSCLYGIGNPEDFYADEDVVITISHLGYIKRTPLSEFRAQSRGGLGAKGCTSRDGDFTEYMFQAKMHDTILFFTTQGKVYKMRCFELPEGNRQSKGRAIQNMLSLEQGDSLNVCINIWDIRDTEFINTYSIVFCTRQGVVKKTSMVEYQNVNAKGKRAINIREDDAVVSVCLVKDGQELLIATSKGRANRFKSDVIRQMGRVATGVRGITLDGDDDYVVGMLCVSKPEEETALVVSSKGFGKRSLVSDYRETNRGTKGVKTMNLTEKTGDLIAFLRVTDEQDLMIINKSGITIRLHVSNISQQGRVTQGVKLIELQKRKDVIASVCAVPAEEDEEVPETTENENAIINENENANENAIANENENENTNTPNE